MVDEDSPALRTGANQRPTAGDGLLSVVFARQLHCGLWKRWKLVTCLASQGYSIRSVVDTASKLQGKDIVAITPEGRELWVSVKGFPESNSFTQARHYFAQAVFDVILYRSENPVVELALALPDMAFSRMKDWPRAFPGFAGPCR